MAYYFVEFIYIHIFKVVFYLVEIVEGEFLMINYSSIPHKYPMILKNMIWK